MQVITHLTNLLQDVLHLAGWDGEELRITGNSLGTQVALGMAANFRGVAAYRDKVKRIALFDHYMDNRVVPDGIGRSPSAHINEVVLPAIFRDSEPDTRPVIENYRTSGVTGFWASNPALNRKTVFVELWPAYYPKISQPLRHTVGISMYLHCMKWNGPVSAYVGTQSKQTPVLGGAPSSRMSTDDLREVCAADEDGNCQTWFEQKKGFYTTWDSDDLYKVRQWSETQPKSRAR